MPANQLVYLAAVGFDMFFMASESIIRSYLALLAESAPPPWCVADVEHLPYPKEQIKDALLRALSQTTEHDEHSELKRSYMRLADWQAGVGEQAVGLDLTKIDTSQGFESAARQIESDWTQGQRWLAIVDAEREELEMDLRRRGFW